MSFSDKDRILVGADCTEMEEASVQPRYKYRMETVAYARVARSCRVSHPLRSVCERRLRRWHSERGVERKCESGRAFARAFSLVFTCVTLI